MQCVTRQSCRVVADVSTVAMHTCPTDVFTGEHLRYYICARSTWNEGAFRGCRAAVLGWCNTATADMRTPSHASKAGLVLV